METHSGEGGKGHGSESSPCCPNSGSAGLGPFCKCPESSEGKREVLVLCGHMKFRIFRIFS